MALLADKPEFMNTSWQSTSMSRSPCSQATSTMNTTISTGTKPESLAMLKISMHGNLWKPGTLQYKIINKHIDLEPAYEPIRNRTIQATNQRRDQPPPHQLNFTPQPVNHKTY